MPPPLRANPGNYHFYAYDNDQALPWTPGSIQPTRGGLQFYSMVKDLVGLQAFGAAQGVPNIALANAGVGINLNGTTRFTKLLSFGGAVANSPAVLFTGGIHAREWVAPAMAYLLAEYLIVNYQAAPATRYATALKKLVDNRRIYIAPMLNPHGNSYTVYSPAANARMWRKNRRRLPITALAWANQLALPNPPLAGLNVPPPAVGKLARYTAPDYPAGATTTTIQIPAGAQVGVDLNRNCASQRWGHCTGRTVAARKDNGLPSTEVYFGPRVASELESQNIQAAAVAANAGVGVGGPGGLAGSIDYHSYSKAILYPSEVADGIGAALTPDYTGLGEILQTLIRPAVESRWSYDYRLGSPRSVIGYDAAGTLGDHIAQAHGSRAFVIELDPDDDPPGFELPENQIQMVFEKNLRGALAMIASAGRQSVVRSSWCGWGRRTVRSSEAQFLGWNVWGQGNQLP